MASPPVGLECPRSKGASKVVNDERRWCPVETLTSHGFAMVSAALGRFIDFHLVGGGVCDEHWHRVAEVFQKMVPKRT